MKTNSTKRSPTLGEFITRVYDDCGEREAKGIVRPAIMLHLIGFRGHKRAVIS